MKKLLPFLAIGLIAMITIATAIGLSDPNTENLFNDTDSAETSSSDGKTHDIGKTVTVGKLEYTITASSETNEIKSNNQFVENKGTEGKFVVIDAKIKNNDKTERTIDNVLFLLKDPKGREFKPLSDAVLITALEDKFLLLKTINPGLSLAGQIIFEVPKDVTSYNLEVSGGILTGSDKTETFKIK